MDKWHPPPDFRKDEVNSYHAHYETLNKESKSMTTQPLMTRIVECTVAGHEVWNGKPCTKLDIPSWSQYPTTLYNVKPDVQAQLPIGQSLVLVLNADKLKDGKDGRQPYDYFWSFVRIANPDESPTPVQQQPPANPDIQDGREATSYTPPIDKETAIRRAVALKAAVDYQQWYPAPDENHIDYTLGMAEQFDAWLQGGSE